MRRFRSLWPTFALISGWVIGATLAAHAEELPAKDPVMSMPADERAPNNATFVIGGVGVAQQTACVGPAAARAAGGLCHGRTPYPVCPDRGEESHREQPSRRHPA